MKEFFKLLATYSIVAISLTLFGCEQQPKGASNLSNDAIIELLSITTTQKEYTANISGLTASIRLEKGESIPTSVTVKILTISGGASASVMTNDKLDLKQGEAKVTVTSASKAFKSTYTLRIYASSTTLAPNYPKPKRKFSVGFYNCENLFDTEDAPKKDDKEFLPTSAKEYTLSVYNQKIQNIAEVLKAMEEENLDDSLAWIGLAEVENHAVLKDLVAHSHLKDYNWEIIHVESSDPRGIDVALLYNPLLFTPSSTKKVIGVNDSREIIWIQGSLVGKKVNIYLNHWTSRIRGGADKRAQFATAVKAQVDKIFELQASEYIFIVGDFNDNPDDASIQTTLAAKAIEPALQNTYLMNGFKDLQQLSQQGTSFYNGGWDIFDQIILSSDMHPSNESNKWRHLSSNIFNPTFMQVKSGVGSQSNAPKRFYEGNDLVGGYSDHFPVYVTIGIY